MKINKKYLFIALSVFIIVVGPITWSTIYGGGTARFNYVSVFSDPTVVPEVGFARFNDLKVRGGGDVQLESKPALLDRMFHNKFTLWATTITANYFQAFSTEFLFTKGDDVNLRHSIKNMGEFYEFEAVLLLAGVLFLLSKHIDKKIRTFIFFWLMTSPIPSAITRDGGNHATRLFFLLPPLVLISAVGTYYSWKYLKNRQGILFVAGYVSIFLVSFISYQHNYWIHYPWDSERWWHAGFRDAIRSAVSEGAGYKKIIISTADEPPLIFFLGWSAFPPSEFQANNPMPTEKLFGFGEMSKLDKYYFGPAGLSIDVYRLGSFLDKDTLYLSTAKEVNVNLIQEPYRTPGDLKIIKAIAYPSGWPAFYLFAKKTD